MGQNNEERNYIIHWKYDRKVIETPNWKERNAKKNSGMGLFGRIMYVSKHSQQKEIVFWMHWFLLDSADPGRSGLVGKSNYIRPIYLIWRCFYAVFHWITYKSNSKSTKKKMWDMSNLGGMSSTTFFEIPHPVLPSLLP